MAKATNSERLCREAINSVKGQERHRLQIWDKNDIGCKLGKKDKNDIGCKFGTRTT